MGKRKHLDKIEELLRRSPVVSFRSIEKIVGKESNYAKLLVSNMMKKGKMRRLTKGFYTANDEISLVVFCFKPAYLGLQSALSLHGVWEQETVPIVLTANKVRTGQRNISGGNVYIRHIDTKYLFGFDYFKDGEFYLPYSDMEKTLIDMVVFRQKIPADALKKIKGSIDRKRLNRYLRQYSMRTRKAVLGSLSSI